MLLVETALNNFHGSNQWTLPVFCFDTKETMLISSLEYSHNKEDLGDPQQE
jgi:hypothetical protein